MKNENLKVRLVKNKNELQAVMEIRKTVFVGEQNVPLDLEMDESDKTAKHIIAFYNGRPAGCARITFSGKKAKLERLALLKPYRGKGLGKAITVYLIDYCKRRKASEIMMHAQYYLKDFYEKLGFRQMGKPFMEAGIKHIEMHLRHFPQKMKTSSMKEIE